MYYGVEATIK